MSRTRGTKLAAALLAELGCWLIFSIWFGRPASTSAKAAPVMLGTKIVDLDAQFRSDPVTYTKVTYGEKEIQPGLSTGPDEREVHAGTPFQADENWLKNCLFRS